MHRKLYHAFIATMLAFLAGITCYAEPLVTSGRAGGGYYTAGLELARSLGSRQPSEDSLPSQGSEENITRVAAGEAKFGFTQADALLLASMRTPAAAANVQVVGTLGKEAVFVTSRRDGPVDDLSDLRSAGMRLAAGAPGSGSALTWETITRLDKTYAKTKTTPDSPEAGLAKLRAGMVDAVLWVQSPTNRDHRILRTVLDSKDLQLVPVTGWNLNDELPQTKRPVYEKETVKIADGFFGSGYRTITTTALVIAGLNVPQDLLDRAAAWSLQKN